MTLASISVVLPTYNRQGRLSTCLESLERQTLELNRFEVIVVNDGSDDGTSNYLKEFSKKTNLTFKFINQQNSGPATARNKGVESSVEEYIAFIDDDCVASERWLEDYLSMLPLTLGCAGVGGRIKNVNEDPRESFLEVLGVNQHSEPNKIGHTSYLITANALYKKEAFENVRGFDQQLNVPGGEDSDLSQRMIERGFHLKVSDRAVVFHHDRIGVISIYKTLKLYGYGEKMRAVKGSIPFVYTGPKALLYLFKYLNGKINSDIKISYSTRVIWMFYQFVYCLGYLKGYRKKYKLENKLDDIKPIPLKENSALASIIILHNNCQSNLIQSIMAALRFPEPDVFELIVAVDGQNLNFEEEAFCLKMNVKVYLCRPEMAKNIGLENAKGRYILMLNSSVQVDWSFVRKGIYIFENNVDHGVIYANYSPMEPNRKQEKKHGPFSISSLLAFYGLGDCLLFRKECWNKTDGFDEKVDLNLQYWEFCINVYKQNWKFYHLDETMYTNSMAQSGKSDFRENLTPHLLEKHGELILQGYRETILELKTILDSTFYKAASYFFIPFYRVLYVLRQRKK